MIPRLRRRLLVGVVGTLASIAGLSGLAFAAGVPQDTTTASAAAAESTLPPFAVEDHAYPDADEILAEQGIILKHGDGHILLTECDGTGSQIEVYSRDAGTGGKYCFRTTAPTGWLTLEVPDVYALATGPQAISADLTANGQTETVDVPQDGFKAVGEGTTGDPTVLVEIRVNG